MVMIIGGAVRCLPALFLFGVSDFALTPVALLPSLPAPRFLVQGGVCDNKGPGIYIPESAVRGIFINN